MRVVSILYVRPSLRLSVRPERRCHFNTIRISGIGQKFGIVMQNTMQQIAI